MGTSCRRCSSDAVTACDVGFSISSGRFCQRGSSCHNHGTGSSKFFSEHCGPRPGKFCSFKLQCGRHFECVRRFCESSLGHDLCFTDYHRSYCGFWLRLHWWQDANFFHWNNGKLKCCSGGNDCEHWFYERNNHHSCHGISQYSQRVLQPD